MSNPAGAQARSAVLVSPSITFLLVALVTNLARAQSLTDPNLTVQTIASGLSQPTTMVFLAPNDFLICEKASGNVQRVTGGTIQGAVLSLPINSDSERGVLGITLDPAFSSNHFVYIYYSRAATLNGAWIENRVARFHWTGAALDPASETLIVNFPSSATLANGPNHNGGIIAFGPDGKLYGTTGDLNRRGIEQNFDAVNVSGVGGIFRLNSDGTIPADNPFIANADVRIRRQWCYGVRNSFGFRFDPATGKLWMTDNGPDNNDEINIAFSGWDGGWSIASGLFTPAQQADLVLLPGATYADPKFSFQQTVGITSLGFITGTVFPASLQGRIIIGDNNTGRLYLFQPNAARNDLVLTGVLADRVANPASEASSLVWGTNFGVTTDLKMGPDGLLYQVSLSDGKVNRIAPRAPHGDMNCDGFVNNFDINAFVLAILTPATYATTYPNCNILNGDIDNSGATNNFDIDAFVNCVLNTGCP